MKGITYIPKYIEESAQMMLHLMSDVPWDDVGKSRRACFMSSPSISGYGYSGRWHERNDIPDWLKPMFARLAEFDDYNACLLNLYETGKNRMGWHSDNEESLVEGSSIAILSFGSTRILRFKHEKGNMFELPMLNGSLLIMSEDMRTEWKHCIEPIDRIVTPRVSLTFRKVKEDNV